MSSHGLPPKFRRLFWPSSSPPRPQTPIFSSNGPPPVSVPLSPLSHLRNKNPRSYLLFSLTFSSSPLHLVSEASKLIPALFFFPHRTASFSRCASGCPISSISTFAHQSLSRFAVKIIDVPFYPSLTSHFCHPLWPPPLGAHVLSSMVSYPPTFELRPPFRGTMFPPCRSPQD